MGTAGAKVTVASKLPMAFEMQLCEKRVAEVRAGGSIWTEEIFHKTGKIVTINGTAFPNGDVPEGMERPVMAFGAALTFGVDKDFFDKWMEANKTTDLVRNHMVFAAVGVDSIKAKAKEFKELDSGLGPIQHGKDKDGHDVITDKRVLKKVRPGYRQVRDEASELNVAGAE